MSMRPIAHCGSLATTAVLLLAVVRCSDDTATNGGGSTTQTAAVTGTLYRPDGVTPAAGVRVRIRPRATLADTSGLGKALVDTGSVVTNDSGRYAFDTTLDTGTYVVEAASGNDAVLIDSVVVQSNDSVAELPPDTLKPAGALKGVVRLSEGGDPRKVFVLAFGIDRFAAVDSFGAFKFRNLAEARYDLRLISSLDDYGVLDVGGVSVASADTTNLDTIDLPFTGIPTPRNVVLSYDTMMQIVTLTWGRADTALVASYNVYRRNVGLNTVLARINASPVTDTVYRDSTGVQDSVYEYAVAAVNRTATEGVMSSRKSVTVQSGFSMVDTVFAIGNAMGTFAVDGRENIYATNLDSNQICVYASDGRKLRQWTVPRNLGWDYIRANNLYFDERGNLHVYTYYDSVIVFDTLGIRVKAFGALIGSCEGMLVFHDTFYIANEQPNRKIIVFDSAGRELRLIDHGWGISDNFYSFLGDSVGTLFLLGGSSAVRGSVLMRMGREGGLLDTVGVVGELPDGVLSEKNGIFLLASNSLVYCFDTQAGPLYRFSVPQPAVKAIPQSDGSILVGLKSGAVVRYAPR